MVVLCSGRTIALSSNTSHRTSTKIAIESSTTLSATLKQLAAQRTTHNAIMMLFPNLIANIVRAAPVVFATTIACRSFRDSKPLCMESPEDEFMADFFGKQEELALASGNTVAAKLFRLDKDKKLNSTAHANIVRRAKQNELSQSTTFTNNMAARKRDQSDLDTALEMRRKKVNHRFEAIRLNKAEVLLQHHEESEELRAKSGTPVFLLDDWKTVEDLIEAQGTAPFGSAGMPFGSAGAPIDFTGSSATTTGGGAGQGTPTLHGTGAGFLAAAHGVTTIEPTPMGPKTRKEWYHDKLTATKESGSG